MAVNFLEITPTEEYLLVEKVEESESEGGIVMVESILNLARIIRDGTGLQGSEGKIAILHHPPDHDLRNGQFLTHKSNVLAIATIKETEKE